jgi:hypothetical protein
MSTSNTCKAVNNTLWREIDEDLYHDRLGDMYPSYRTGHGFQSGEAATHLVCTVNGCIEPAYDSFVVIRKNISTCIFYKSVTPLSNAEFEQITPAIVMSHCVEKSPVEAQS